VAGFLSGLDNMSLNNSRIVNRPGGIVLAKNFSLNSGGSFGNQGTFVVVGM